MRRTPAFLVACLTIAVLVAGRSARCETPEPQTSSPDWHDQIVYFVMIDRFDDGDPSNNDQGVGEFDPADPRKYSGGDLKGIARRIDYIRDLGATALWITPPVANQWWDGELGYGGYHGYWAEHFMRVDAHYGTLHDYRSLAKALRAAGMRLIQDVVVNHTGNFFTYRDGWNPEDPADHFRLNRDSRPVAAPTQWPFRLNDARDPQHREAAVYHWTPTITDFGDRRQELDFQLADLDDLDTGNALVREALRKSYGFWIREVGVDAFRVDTAYHVPAAFFRDFLHATDGEHPGMHAVARAAGREAFFAFGEGFGIDAAFDDRHARKLETYVRDGDGPLLDAMINFPLYGSLQEVFARGRPSAVLAHRIDSMMKVHAQPHLMPTFVDNHDVDRFLAGADEAALKQALLALMTLPGIPVIYYGTEQGFRERRQAMFAGGYGAAGRDRFDRESPLFRFVRSLTTLRREHRLFSRGAPTLLHANEATPGAIAWRMTHDGNSAIVILNSADRETLLDRLDGGHGPGALFRVLFSLTEAPESLRADAGGHLTLRLPPRAGLVLTPVGEAATTPAEPAPARISICPAAHDAAVWLSHPSDCGPSPDLRPDAWTVYGNAEGIDRFQLVVDGDIGGAQTVGVDAEGRWRARIDTVGRIDPDIVHRVLAWSESPAATSVDLRFRVRPRWTLLAEVADPAADDHGPEARYRYPTDPSWGANRQLDILGMRVSGSEGSLRIEMDMHRVTQSWNPAHGFDHVAFTAYLQLPGRDDGTRVMPLQNSLLPDGMRWHYRLRVGGWSNVLHAAPGADRDREGSPVAAAARIEVDASSRRIIFTVPATAIGKPQTLTGARLFVTTWDQDGAYRSLEPSPGSHTFGGGDGSVDPLIMDSVLAVLAADD